MCEVCELAETRMMASRIGEDLAVQQQRGSRTSVTSEIEAKFERIPTGSRNFLSSLGSKSMRTESYSAEGSPLNAETRKVPKPQRYSKHAASLALHLIEAQGLLACDTNILGQKTSSDPYCVLEIVDEEYRAKTRVVPCTLSPSWNELFRVQLKYPPTIVRITLMDRDLTSKDDYMGEVILDLTKLPPHKRITGWIPVTHRDSVVAGMIRLSVLLHYDMISTILGYARKRDAYNRGEGYVLPKFDLGELYTPLMLINDVVVTRTILPLSDFILHLVTWTDPKKSLAALFLIWPLTRYIHLWPSMVCWLLTLKMGLSFKSRNIMSSALTHAGLSQLPQEEGEGLNENMTLGSFVVRITRLAPRWLKESLASLQPPVRQTADGLHLIHDVLHWRHPMSKRTLQALILLGLVLTVAPFGVTMYIVCAGALLAMSPITCLLFGISDYLTEGRKDTSSVHVVEEFDDRFLSVDAKRKVKN